MLMFRQNMPREELPPSSNARRLLGSHSDLADSSKNENEVMNEFLAIMNQWRANLLQQKQKEELLSAAREGDANRIFKCCLEQPHQAISNGDSCQGQGVNDDYDDDLDENGDRCGRTRRSNVQLLLATVRTNDKAGDLPLHVASRYGRLSAVTALLELGASVNATNRLNDTPLHLAKNAAIAKLLIDNGANMSARGHRGWTPTIAHSAKGNCRVVRVLVEQRRMAERCQAEIESKQTFIAQWLMNSSSNNNDSINNSDCYYRRPWFTESSSNNGDNDNIVIEYNGEEETAIDGDDEFWRIGNNLMALSNDDDNNNDS